MIIITDGNIFEGSNSTASQESLKNNFALSHGVDVANVQIFDEEIDFEDILFLEVNDGVLSVDEQKKKEVNDASAKTYAINQVREYAENMRLKFTGGAKDKEIHVYQMNSDILNFVDVVMEIQDIDIYAAYEKLKPEYKEKIQIRLNGQPEKYPTFVVLFDVWRKKRSGMAIGTEWVDVIEKNTIAAIEAASGKEEVDSIIASSKQQAEAKAAELMSTA